MDIKNIEKRAGFSLFELAIVLVIIGLVVTVIFSGRALIENAYRRKIISEVESIRTAVMAFHLQYDALPGDMPNASEFWPDCDATPSNCNGDNDGRIDIVDPPTPPLQAEELRAWQQLGAAGLISWQLSGVSNITPPLKVGYNVPRSGFGKNNAAYRLAYAVMPVEMNSVKFVNPEDTVSYWGASISAVDAIAIDRKYDDGKPGSGKIFVLRGYLEDGWSTNCVDQIAETAVPTAYIFPLSNEVVCTMDFFMLQ